MTHAVLTTDIVAQEINPVTPETVGILGTGDDFY